MGRSTLGTVALPDDAEKIRNRVNKARRLPVLAYVFAVGAASVRVSLRLLHTEHAQLT